MAPTGNLDRPTVPPGADHPPTDPLPALVLGRALPAALDRLLRSPGPQPFLTYVDHGTGERTELSAATAANWASKVAGLLSYEVAVDPADPPAVGARMAGAPGTSTPAGESGTAHDRYRGVLGVIELATDGHWAAVPAALGAWRMGLAVAPDDPTEPGRTPETDLEPDPDAAVPPSDIPPPGRVPGRSAAGDLRIAWEDFATGDDLAVGPGLGGRPSPDADVERAFVEEVLREPDDVDAGEPPQHAVAVLGDGPAIDFDEVLAGLADVAGRRLLLLDRVDSRAGLVALAAAVVHGASLVVVRDTGPGLLDHTRLGHLVTAERVTTAVGSSAVRARLAAPDLPELQVLTLPG